MAEHIQEVQEKPQETPNTEEANAPREDDILWLRTATAFVCIVNLAYVVTIAVVIGKLKGWPYSIHCFILCLFILFSFVQTVRANTKLLIKSACWISCSTSVLVVMTAFTLLTRQAYYHPSPHFESKWVLFSLQAIIFPLLCGILVMYEFKIIGLRQKRFILIIAILDFADIWDMASILSQHKPPYLKEESSLEITVQFFCSLSFSIFSVLIYQNIEKEGLRFMFKKFEEQPASDQTEVQAQHSIRWICLECVVSNCSCCLEFVVTNSPLYLNIPFLIIRILVVVYHGFLDSNFLAKNFISVILFFLDCCKVCLQNTRCVSSQETGRIPQPTD